MIIKRSYYSPLIVDLIFQLNGPLVLLINNKKPCRNINFFSLALPILITTLKDIKKEKAKLSQIPATTHATAKPMRNTYIALIIRTLTRLPNISAIKSGIETLFGKWCEIFLYEMLLLLKSSLFVHELLEGSHDETVF